MGFFQNLFDQEYQGYLVLADRKMAPTFKVAPNRNLQSKQIAWNTAPYDLSSNNLLEFTVALGMPEIIHEGTDITIVSYGSMLRVIEEAVVRLTDEGISVELIDVQTLLPFDINHSIVKSLQKTNRILFIDEDVPGGATAYMFNHVMEEQGGYKWLDASPKTLAAKAHRPAYGSDGDYFSKPNTEDVIEAVRAVMAE
jgi:pyruvate/2-oxoglutarate/acetoin dehydrogenase E1 component